MFNLLVVLFMALGRKKTGTNNPLLAEVVTEAQKENLIPLHVQIPASLHQQTKMFAVQSGQSVKDIVIAALEYHLEQQSK
ncbi:MAG TPA: hypothetical protein PKC11_06730 [Agitococcus sp.]|jgi:hypothetical protein|nr:hypothetical protein [Agitococcus sp.]HMX99729.1 hypothetical protein [Agitococcus sp.]HNA20625.1 hypothetical protein [Agitococcus sp.]HNB20062.1 hypothetical protein [Agitococcus sp.]HNC02734.1 hypothetical protein [Agitococcus sp.]